MESSLASLEEKVLHAVDLIRSLRAENERLRAERDAFATRLDDVQQNNQVLNRELEEARQSVADAERFEIKRRAIEEKVGGLLEKLEAIG
jgi:FtsZ-binding cell division protein ZapB